jgi:hypothetical protein
MRNILLAFALTVFFLNSTAHAEPAPKELHFIWIGKDIPELYVANIMGWAARNKDYKINIWSDKSATISNTISKMDGASSLPFQFRDIDEVKKENLKTHPKLISYLERESSGKFPNYAAASDILRLLILNKEGGIYVDTDETPTEYYSGEYSNQKEDMANPEFREIYLRHLDKLNDRTKAQILAIQEYEKSGNRKNIKLNSVDAPCGMLWYQRLRGSKFISACNNLVAATPKSPMTEAAISKIETEYERLEKEKGPHSHDNLIWESKRRGFPIKDSDSKRGRTTIDLSGPGLYDDYIFHEVQNKYPDQLCTMLKSIQVAIPLPVQVAIGSDYENQQFQNELNEEEKKHIATFCLTRFPIEGITDREVSEKWNRNTDEYRSTDLQEIAKKAKASFPAEAAF